MMGYDCIVIGGGAAGLFCAGQRAALGERVLVLEGRERPARKLLITGKGRCNVANDCAAADFLAAVRTNPRFLYSAVNSFSPADTMAFFEGLGVPLKTERGGRVFPQSDKAMDIVDALIKYVRDSGAEIITARAEHIITKSGAVTGVSTVDGTVYSAPVVVLATGGMSYPATGSDGEGYRMARELGHTIVPPRPSLISIICKGPRGMFPSLAGLSLRNVTLTLYSPDKRRLYSELGEMLFTHTGISGPLALTASSYIEGAPEGYALAIDLKPGLTAEQLDARLLRDFAESPNRQLANSLDKLLPKKLILDVIRAAGVSAETRINSLTREQRAALIGALKAFPLSVAALGPIEEAIITAGGISTTEISPKDMSSKLVPGLRFAGEIIDVDARTGGYNLQIAWSTAWLAANR